jgi:Arc/MetJ family transcription regulator
MRIARAVTRPGPQPPAVSCSTVVYALHITRTNVEIDEELVQRVMRRYGLTTKRSAIDLALRRLDLEPMSREEALAMRGSGWDGDLEELRGGYLRRGS